MKKYMNAFAQACIAACVWSLLGPILNISSFTAFQTIWLTSLFTVVFLFLFHYVTGKNGQLRIIQLNTKLVFFFLSSGLSGVLWFYSLTLLPIAQAALLYSVVPLFTFILGYFFLKENFQFTKLAALIIGSLGVGFIVVNDLSDLSFVGNFLGVGVVLSAACLTAVQTVTAKKLSLSYPNWVSVLLIMLSQCLITTPFAFSHRWSFTLFAIGSVLFLSVFSSIIAFFCYVNSLRTLRSSTVTMIGYIEPLLAALWGYLFLGQSISITVAFGGIAIFVSGYMVIRDEKKKTVKNIEISPERERKKVPLLPT